MMKNIMTLSTVACISFLCGASLAGDFTIMKSLDPHSHKVSGLEIPKGQTTIDVIPSEKDAVISCRLTNADGDIFERNKEHRCDFYLNLKMPQVMNLRVTNESSGKINYTASLKVIK